MSKSLAYAIFPILGFLLLGGYIVVIDGGKFGWNDLGLLAARGAGAGTFGAMIGLGIAWLITRRKNPT